MSLRDWRNGFAIGLTSGLVVTALLFTFNGWAKQLAKCVGHGNCEGYAKKYEGGNTPDWWWWRWTGDVVSSSDTLAQWIMAILTIVAVALLWLTLRQADKTNQSAIVAASEASESNRIMRLDTRPWVTLEADRACTFHRNGSKFQLAWKSAYLNRGKTPGFRLDAQWEVVGYETPMDVRGCLNALTTKVAKGRFFPSMDVVFPGEESDLVDHGTLGDGTLAHDSGIYSALICCLVYSFNAESESEIGIDARAFMIESLGDDATERGECVLREIIGYRVVR